MAQENVDYKKVMNEWRPEPKQELFLSVPTTIKEAFYGGGELSVSKR